MNGSVIGRGTVVRGNVRGSGSLEILGRVEGDVSVSGELVIGEEGAVRGSVTGSHVTCAGAVQGDVRGSEAVLLERGARVVGDLTAPRVGVASGALVKGLVRTDGEAPLAAAARRPVAQARPIPFPAPARPAAPTKSEPRVEPPEAPAESEPASAKEPKAAREAPPPPVVPALAKGAKAKKKTRED
ncbi:MAG TPA: polymer-forming cytoskeletal protein [Polyangiaceae bacterium]|jgi:cytoskeletal protein CcmA (bactofilin family)|nr:polymer-forming cytoskeletal protein [Polyangiaceae bacterium]